MNQVHTFDISHSNYKKHGLPIISKCPETHKKIHLHEGPAIDSIGRERTRRNYGKKSDKLIQDGHSGTFDFAFIDADKENYTNYYNRCIQLLKPGGVIVIDNVSQKLYIYRKKLFQALWSGRVVDPKPDDASSKAIDAANKAIFADNRSNSFLVNCGDGIHVAFKI